MTIANTNLPELLAASSDGIFAFHFLSQAYNNSGETAEEHDDTLRLTFVKLFVHEPHSNLTEYTTLFNTTVL